MYRGEVLSWALSPYVGALFKLNNINKAACNHFVSQRENRVLFTSFLMRNGYTESLFFSRFWGISEATAKQYMREAGHLTLADGDVIKIMEIKTKNKCNLPTAVSIYYERLSKGCFIATAAYGTPLAPEIEVLRNYRDDCLKKSELGNWFVNKYYDISPPIARFISDKPIFRAAVRISLKPIIKLLNESYAY